MSKIKRALARARGYSGGGSVGPAPKSNRLVGEFRDPGEHAGGRRFLAPDDLTSRDLDARRGRDPREPYPARGRARAALADGGSVLDDLRESLEMRAASVHSPEERAANRTSNIDAVLGALPVTGNVMSAMDVPQSARDAVQAWREGRYKAAAGNAALTGLNVAGAISPLPWGRAAGEAARDAGRTARIFAGPTSKTADLAALRQAEAMRGAGASRDEIRDATGWFQGPGGGWRYEIDDSAVTVREDGGPAGTLIDHPELFTAYPELGKTPMRAEIGPHSGDAYVRGDGSTSYIHASAKTPDELRGVALHEMQHGIQGKEGWSAGANPQGAFDYRPKPDLDALNKHYLDEWDKLEAASFAAQAKGDKALAADLLAQSSKAFRMSNFLDKRGYGAYWRNPGEVEARNVQDRRSLTAAQRATTAPWDTQSVPDDLFSMAKAKKPVKKYANGGRIKGALSRARVVTGAVRGKTGGREDALPVDVPAGAYVVPADVVAALGGGNSEAGMHRLEKMYGRPRRANGGRVPILISHGEFVLTPEAVERAGGADALDGKVVALRNAWARHLQELEGPNK